jgi:hypothetical protein
MPLDASPVPERLTVTGEIRDRVESDPDPRVRIAAQQILSGQSTRRARWIGVYLHDQRGRPLPRSAFALVLPSGLVKAALTDTRGQHWEQDVTPGLCFAERP